MHIGEQAGEVVVAPVLSSAPAWMILAQKYTSLSSRAEDRQRPGGVPVTLLMVVVKDCWLA